MTHERSKIPSSRYLLSSREKHALLSQLTVRLEAGQGLNEALESSGHDVSPNARLTARRMAEHVASGSTFTEAASTCPELFGRHELAILEIGEEHGRQTEALRAVEASSRWLAALHRKVLIALFYPAFLLNLAYLCFNVSVLVGGDPGAYLLGLILLDLVLATLYLGALFSRRNEGTRLMADTLVLRAPPLDKVFAHPVLRYQQARLFSLLGSALDAGAGSQRALELAAEAASNEIVRRDLQGALGRLREGDTWGRAMAPCDTLTNGQREMIETAELAGRLPDVLETLADAARFDLALWIRQFYKIMPVVLLVATILAIVLRLL